MDNNNPKDPKDVVDQSGTSDAQQAGPRAWNMWLNVDGVDLTFWYLIREYRMVVGALDPTFKFAGAQARAKALLLRGIIGQGNRALLFEE